MKTAWQSVRLGTVVLALGSGVCIARAEGAAGVPPAPAGKPAAPGAGAPSAPASNDKYPASWWLDEALRAGVARDSRNEVVWTLLDLGRADRAFDYLAAATGPDVDTWRAAISRGMVERFVARGDMANARKALEGVAAAADFLPAGPEQRFADANLAVAALLVGDEVALDRALGRLDRTEELRWEEFSSYEPSQNWDRVEAAQSVVLRAVNAGNAELAKKFCDQALSELFGKGADQSAAGIILPLAEAGRAHEIEILAGPDGLSLATCIDVMAHFAEAGNAEAAKKWRAAAAAGVEAMRTTVKPADGDAWARAALADVGTIFVLATLVHDGAGGEPRHVWDRFKDAPHAEATWPPCLSIRLQRTRDEGAMLAAVGFAKAGKLDRADSILGTWNSPQTRALAHQRVVMALAETGRFEEALERLPLITHERGMEMSGYRGLQDEATLALAERLSVAGRTDLLHTTLIGSESTPRLDLKATLRYDAIGRLFGREALEHALGLDKAKNANHSIEVLVPAMARYGDRAKLAAWIGSQHESVRGGAYLLAARTIAEQEDLH